MLARSDLRVHMVFLTPDGKPAKNPEALLATWIRSALALAHAFQPSASTVQHAFGNLLTHFLNNGPGTAKLTMRRVREFRAAVPKPTDAQLLAQFGLVEAALRLLTPVLYEDTMSDRDPEDFFSEAAVLYASNTTVIEALETECRDRTKALCGAVRRELLGRMPGVDLDLAGKAWPKGGDLYLWFDRADPLILGDVRLQVTVYKTERVSGEAALESGRRAVEAAGASTVDVAPSTSAQKVMTVDVPFSKTNPVQSLADRLERLLRGLAE
jgi:hypothetical protein